MKKTKEEMIKLAFSFLDRGWSILPVGLDKRPLLPWKLWQTKYPPKENVESWFERFPDCQIGIITGSLSNLTVVDCEKGADPSELPQNTMIVQSGGLGFHYLYLYEEGVTNKARIKELTDLRSQGGYILSYGSRSSKGEYILLQDLPLLPFPKHLFPEKVNIFEVTQATNHKFEKGELETYSGFAKGQRNDEMSRYIGYILTQIHPSNWETEARHLIEQANTANTPPLSPRELETTFKSIKDIEVRNNPLGRGGNFEQQTNYQEPIILDRDDDEVKLLSEVAKENETRIGLADIIPLNMPYFDEPLLGGFYIGDLVVIAGLPSHGKTHLSIQWTMSFLKREKPIKTLWFTFELLPQRLNQKFTEMGAGESDLIYCPARNTSGNVAWVENKIIEAKKKFGVKAIVIDHLGFLLPKSKTGALNKNMSSNYSMYLTQITRDLKTVAIQQEVIIILPVHVKKPDRYKKDVDNICIEDIANSAGISQESDAVFLIFRKKDTRENAKQVYLNQTKITLAKNRHSEMTRIEDFMFMNGKLVHDNSERMALEEFDAYQNSKEIQAEKERLEKAKKDIIAQEEKIKEKEQEVEDEDLADVMKEAWNENVVK